MKRDQVMFIWLLSDQKKEQRLHRAVYRAEGAVEDQCDENQTQTCHDNGNNKSHNLHDTLESIPPTLSSLCFGIFEVLIPICDGRSTYRMTNQTQICGIHRVHRTT